MQKKRVLLITSAYFNYYKAIAKELENLNFSVDYFIDRPTQNNLFKAVSRIRPKMVEKFVERYFDEIIEKTSKEKYDYVFFIRAMSYCFNNKMMQRLKDSQPQAVFLSYQWDSVRNLYDVKNYWRFFDRCYSFDRIDCNENKNLKFLPLFYDRDYQSLGENKPKEFKYDCCYIGTAHPKKYKMIEEMAEKLKGVYNNQFIFHYMPSRLKYFYHKLKNVEYKNAKFSDFKTAVLPKEQTMDIIKNSKCVLDSPQDYQNGATMRVIECVGAKTKLITANNDVINYDFYRPQNVYIYDGEFDFDNVFFKEPYCELPKDIYLKYSLKSFIMQIFEMK